MKMGFLMVSVITAQTFEAKTIREKGLYHINQEFFMLNYE
jgi:hypothetical protein